MRIAICDDEQVYINITREYCERYFEDKKINFSVDAYTDSEEFLANVEKYDIVFLDVNMPKVSGIDIKEQIGDRNKKLRIIFISSYPDNMPEAFGERVMGFLVKPLEYDKFAVKMDKVLILAMNDDRYVLPAFSTAADDDSGEGLVRYLVPYIDGVFGGSGWYQRKTGLQNYLDDIGIERTINSVDSWSGSVFKQCINNDCPVIMGLGEHPKYGEHVVTAYGYYVSTGTNIETVIVNDGWGARGVYISVSYIEDLVY